MEAIASVIEDFIELGRQNSKPLTWKTFPSRPSPTWLSQIESFLRQIAHQLYESFEKLSASSHLLYRSLWSRRERRKLVHAIDIWFESSFNPTIDAYNEWIFGFGDWHRTMIDRLAQAMTHLALSRGLLFFETFRPQDPIEEHVDDILLASDPNFDLKASRISDQDVWDGKVTISNDNQRREIIDQFSPEQPGGRVDWYDLESQNDSFISGSLAELGISELNHNIPYDTIFFHNQLPDSFADQFSGKTTSQRAAMIAEMYEDNLALLEKKVDSQIEDANGPGLSFWERGQILPHVLKKVQEKDTLYRFPVKRSQTEEADYQFVTRTKFPLETLDKLQDRGFKFVDEQSDISEF